MEPGEGRRKSDKNLNRSGRIPTFYSKKKYLGRLARYENDIIGFCEKEVYLPEKKNELIKLEDWERKIFEDCFYEKRPRLIVISLAKKNGKSQFSAMTLLWLFLLGERGEIYIASNSKDQSNFITFKKIKDMLRKNRELSDICRVYKDYIENRATGSILRCLSSSFRSSAGLSPSCIALDECSAMDTESLKFFYEELQLSPIYLNPVTLITSTVGREEQGIFWDLYEASKKGNTLDSYFYIKQGLKEANPSSFVTDYYLRKQRDKPGMRKSVFNRLHCNLFSSESDDFISDEDFRGCVDYSLEKRPNKRLPVYVGLDCGYRNDYTAVFVVYKSPELIISVEHKIFRPSPETGTLDFSKVREFILELNRVYFIEGIFYDPYQAISLSQDLTKEKIRMVEIPQTQINCIAFSQCLFTAIKSHTLSFYPSEEVRESLLNCKAVYSSRGWRIVKKREKGKIDLAVACSLAVYGASVTKAKSQRKGEAYHRGMAKKRKKEEGKEIKQEKKKEFKILSDHKGKVYYRNIDR